MKGPSVPRSLLAVLALALVTLGLGLALKDSCNGLKWDGDQYRSLCYSDIVPLYGAHGFDRDVFPYTDHPEMDQREPRSGDPEHPITERWGFVEYPVLTGLHMWFAARMGSAAQEAFGIQESAATFLYYNAVLLAGFALGTVYLLHRMVDDPRRVAFFAAGTAIVLYAFHNWDLMAVFFLVLTLYYFERGRYAASGVALSLGASAKIFPIVAAPFLFIVLWRREYVHPRAWSEAPEQFIRSLLRARSAWRLFVGTVGGFLAVNLPFILFGSREIYFEVFRFHLRRSPNFETLWWVASEYGKKWHVAWLAQFEERTFLDPLIATAFVATVAATLALVWWRRWGPRQAAFAAILLFLILNKVFSVQYALWVLPFFALLPLPVWSYAFYAAADAWVYATIFPFFTKFGEEGALRWLALAVVARSLSLAVLLGLLVARDEKLSEPRSTPEEAPRPFAVSAPSPVER